MNDASAPDRGARANWRVAVLCATLVTAMGGLAYASVPLYRLFCQVTGYGGTTQRAAMPAGPAVDRLVTVRFDANVRGGLGWEFRPERRSVTVRLGETVQANFIATNTGKTASAGSATFNVTPQSTGSYFNKIECFCFTETTLQPGESLTMPVVFFVDPAVADQVETRDIHTITLSYSFFPVAEKPLAAGSGTAASGASGG